jgi:hypothetical protein
MFTQSGITIGTYCEQLLDVTSVRESVLRLDLSIRTGITDDDRLDNLIECFRQVGIVIIPEEQNGFNAQGGVSNLNTEINTNDLQITQEIEESSALEKIEKLKKQWLELLP